MGSDVGRRAKPGLFDVTVPLRQGLPLWPGSPGLEFESLSEISRGAEVNVGRVHLELHTGTHLDAPRHFVADGATVESLPLEVLVGPALVVEARDTSQIDAAWLERAGLESVPQRLLFRTPSSEWWRRSESQFRDDYVALTADAARWLVDRGVRLVGIDYLSIQRFHDGPETHRILLGAGVIVVESLDLSQVEPGTYELICLPIPLVGAEAAPVRVILRPL